MGTYPKANIQLIADASCDAPLDARLVPRGMLEPECDLDTTSILPLILESSSYSLRLFRLSRHCCRLQELTAETPLYLPQRH